MKKILFMLAMLPMMCYAQTIPNIPEPDFDAMLGIKKSQEEGFIFKSNGFVDARDNTKSYLVYEFEGKTLSDLKSSLISSLSDVFNSPKDVINPIGDDLIQIEGYKSDIYTTMIGNSAYKRDIQFLIVIRLKDGKVRYDSPKIKTIYTEWPLGGKVPLDMEKPISVLIEAHSERVKVCNYFNNLIKQINKSISTSDDW